MGSRRSRDVTPMWSGGVPYCSVACAQHDGKRCRVLGFRAPNVCEVAVAAMEPIKPTGADLMRSMRCLGRNLAIAGALDRAFQLGIDRGIAVESYTLPTHEYEAGLRDAWRPNLDGKAAP